jgi:hypothetical protein
MLGFLWLFSTFGLGQSNSSTSGYFLCLPRGKNLDRSDGSPNIAWIRGLFDFDKNPTQANGFIEGRINAIPNTRHCLGTSSHCLLMRVALSAEEVCDGLLSSKTNHPIVANLGVGIQQDFDRPGEGKAVPINIEVNLINTRRTVLIADNHQLSKHFAWIGWRFVLKCSGLHEISNVQFGKCRGTFLLNDFGKSINRDVFGELQLQAFHPCQKVVVTKGGINIRYADSGDSNSILDDNKLLLFDFAGGGGEIGIVQGGLAIATKNDASFRHEHDNGSASHERRAEDADNGGNCIEFSN